MNRKELSRVLAARLMAKSQELFDAHQVLRQIQASWPESSAAIDLYFKAWEEHR